MATLESFPGWVRIWSEWLGLLGRTPDAGWSKGSQVTLAVAAAGPSLKVGDIPSSLAQAMAWSGGSRFFSFTVLERIAPKRRWNGVSVGTRAAGSSDMRGYVVLFFFPLCEQGAASHVWKKTGMRPTRLPGSPTDFR